MPALDHAWVLRLRPHLKALRLLLINAMRLIPIITALFIVIPMIEIYLLIKVGSVIGALPTLGMVILIALAGAVLLRQQGISILGRLQASLMQGQLPTFEILEGGALIVGGVLLMTPGFFTDVLGLVCLWPYTRRLLIQQLIHRLSRTFIPTPATTTRTIEGEAVRRDD